MKRTSLKKFILPLVFLGIFSYLPKNSPALAEDSSSKLEQRLEINNPMPVSHGRFVRIKIDKKEKLEYVYFKDEKIGINKSVDIYPLCSGRTLNRPSAVLIRYNGVETLLIDEKNKAGQYLPDGIIDEIPDMVEIKEKGRYQFHSPECGEEI